ncbi:MAG: KEOPS complex subunit Cgi121 [Candidatus Micrarchaeaceae archaeon]
MHGGIEGLAVAGLQKAVIKRASATVSIGMLVEEARTKYRDGKKGFVQFFDVSAIISRMHMLGAYANALSAFKEKSNASSSVQMEMLLFAAMTRQIGDAVKIAGAKTNEDFLLFATSDKAYRTIADKIKKSEEPVFTRKEGIRNAQRYGINPSKDLDAAVLNAMALSGLLES